MRLRSVQEVCRLSSLCFSHCPTAQLSQPAHTARSFELGRREWFVQVRQGHSMSCSSVGFLRLPAAINTPGSQFGPPHNRLASSKATLVSSTSNVWSEGDQPSSSAAVPEAQPSGDVFSPHPERRGMRNRPMYIPVASPYAAQSPEARVDRKVFARVRDVGQSVKKMNLVARVVRRMHIDDALVQMAYHNTKKSARTLHEILLAARAAARHRQLDIPSLVVDEVLVLRGGFSMKKPVFRAKGGVNMPRRSKCNVYVRLREVPGACMKTAVLRPWWERRSSHRKQGRSQHLIATRSQLLAATTSDEEQHSTSAGSTVRTGTKRDAVRDM